MASHVCVWIDHREARVFEIGLDDASVVSISDPDASHHIHRRADHVHLGKATVDHGFMDEVAKLLKGARAILIAGPGQARTQLAGYLNDRYPEIAKRVWGIEPMDHPSDAQIVAAARKYFYAADRMHP